MNEFDETMIETLNAGLQCCAAANAAVTFLANVLTTTTDPQVAAVAFADLRMACVIFERVKAELRELQELAQASASASLEGEGVGGMVS